MDSTEAGGQQSLFSFGEFILCRRRHCLCRSQEQIHLSGKAFHLLVFLLENRREDVERLAVNVVDHRHGEQQAANPPAEMANGPGWRAGLRIHAVRSAASLAEAACRPAK